MLFHPDKNNYRGAKEAFILIQDAFDILKDQKIRSEYDRRICGLMPKEKQSAGVEPPAPKKTSFHASCSHCEVEYEFPTDLLNTTITCFHCQNTYLACPKHEMPPKEGAGKRTGESAGVGTSSSKSKRQQAAEVILLSSDSSDSDKQNDSYTKTAGSKRPAGDDGTSSSKSKRQQAAETVLLSSDSSDSDKPNGSYTESSKRPQ